MSLIPRGTPFFPGNITDDCSLEVSVKDIAALTAAASRLPPGSTISIPYLPGQDDDARLAAARAVRGLGLEPMPHLSARRIASLTDLEAFVSRAVAEAGVERCFVIAGDPSTPAGPFADSAALIETGVFERAGIKVVGVGAHPDGHPVMSAAQRWEVLERKCRGIGARGMSPLIVTQFGFDADIVLAWLEGCARAASNTPCAWACRDPPVSRCWRAMPPCAGSAPAHRCGPSTVSPWASCLAPRGRTFSWIGWPPD
ncbi:methylenetetrahydrofolate reductase [Achromobacter xylosoxidans]